MANKIEPRVLKGFRDFLPQAEMERRRFISTVEAVFRSFGFVPIDTPALEYTEILLGKAGGETEKQVFRFTDEGGRDVSMRFDLTVPFARFMAEHHDELGLPFKRYHVSKVWRGEKPQRGRYREFYQCDFDCVGADTTEADFEILSLMVASLASLDIGAFRIHFSHRGLFNRFLSHNGISERSVEILRTVDKLGKIGENEVKAQLSDLAGSDKAERILAFIKASGDFETTLSALEGLSGGGGEESARLRSIHGLMEKTGVASSFVLDPSITRGLDYYTGLVFETFLAELPAIGSVCSGGRYDNLASLYTDQKLPGVGASIGMDRLLAALETIHGDRKAEGSCDLLVLSCEEEPSRSFALAARVRQAGYGCEVFTDRKKSGQQYAYAERRGIPVAVSISKEGALSAKKILSRETVELSGVDSLLELLAASRGVK
jgi:histidyl-tRNA synthetase